MKIITHENDTYILRLDKGEEFIETLKNFCVKEGIKAAYFTAIGACENTELAYYDLEKKEYLPKLFPDRMEIVQVTGNVSVMNEEPLIHAHGMLGDPEMNIVGGHVNKMIISTIAEVYLKTFTGEIKKAPDSESGLNILQ